MRRVGTCLGLAALAATAAAAWAGSVHQVEQRSRAFAVSEIDIARRDTVRFVNRDPFLHQIYVYSPAFDFDSDEQPPGTAIDVTFPVAGTFTVQCHIHPTMHLTVKVK